VVASDEAARIYKEKTPIEDQTATGVWDVMNAASNNMVESIKRKDFTKYLAIANPKNGDDFLNEVRPSSCLSSLFCITTTFTYSFFLKLLYLLQINRHFSDFSKPEMSLDKLQKIVPAAVEAKYKARWLRWWNSSLSSRLSYRFPPLEFKDTEFDPWLNKASFWAGVQFLKKPFPLHYALVSSSILSHC
jgi:hypothetical protein